MTSQSCECGFCGQPCDREFCSTACREAWWLDVDEEPQPPRMRPPWNW